MASPQVCGVGALNLQVDPALTPAQLKQKLEGNAPATMTTTGSTTDYNAYTTSIMGSAGKILYNKYNSDQPFATSGGVTITNLRIV
jgi:subtilisin family serine protease